MSEDVNLIPFCGRCGSAHVNHDAHSATPGYAGSVTGCQNCNPTITSDRARLAAALHKLETAASSDAPDEDAIRADERERLSARVYENGWCPTCAARPASDAPIPGPDLGACPRCGDWRKAGMIHRCQGQDAAREGLLGLAAMIEDYFGRVFGDSEPDEADPACHLWNAACGLREHPGDLRTALYADGGPGDDEAAERALIAGGAALAAADREAPDEDRQVLDPETGVEEPVTTDALADGDAPSVPDQTCAACGGTGDRNGNRRAADPFGTCPGCGGTGKAAAASRETPDARTAAIVDALRTDDVVLIETISAALFPLNAHGSGWTGSPFTGFRARFVARRVAPAIAEFIARRFPTKEATDGPLQGGSDA